MTLRQYLMVLTVACALLVGLTFSPCPAERPAPGTVIPSCNLKCHMDLPGGTLPHLTKNLIQVYLRKRAGPILLLASSRREIAGRRY